MHILVADDDLPSVKLTSYLLEEAGYQVVKAYDGPAILQSIEQHNPDLVLLDVTMPKANGFDICRQIRRTSDVPIIFLTGRSQLQDRVMGLQIGGDDYLVKPFEPSELLARVEAVLRRRNSDMLNPSVRLSQGDITLEPDPQQGVGLRLRGREQPGRCLHPAPPDEDRAGSGAPEACDHRSQSRL
jgi:DNA-binding response OmpR family regulator